MSLMIFILLILQASLLGASVISLDITDQRTHSFTFKEVCLKSGHQHTLIASAEGHQKIRCMGEKVDLVEFCGSQDFNRPFLRSYIPPQSDQSKVRSESLAFCVTGREVLLEISCESAQTRSLCASPQKSCQHLKDSYARDLAVSRVERVFVEDDEHLVCHYFLAQSEAKIDADLNIMPMILDD